MLIIGIILFASLNSAFTEKQEDWLKSNEYNIKVGIINYPPFGSYNSEKVEGISIDYLNIITENLGITWAYETSNSTQELFDRIKSKDIDMITSLTSSSELSDFLDFTESYIEIPIGLFSNKKEKMTLDYANNANLKVATGEGYDVQNYLKTNYPGIELIVVNNDFEAIDSLLSKKTDLAVSDIGSASQTIKNNNLKEIYFIAPIGFSDKLTFAFAKEDSIMIEAFNEEIKKIPLNTREQIETKWFELPKLPFYTSQIRFLFVAGGILGIIFLIYLNVLKNRKMNETKEKRGFPELKVLTILIILISVIFIIEKGYLENKIPKTKNMYFILIGAVLFISILMIFIKIIKRNNIAHEDNEHPKEREMELFLKFIDRLFEKLPDKVINEFSNSEDFKIYKKIMERYKI